MFRLTHKPIDTDSLKAQLDLPGAGGHVIFEGAVRDHHAGRAVRSLEYEAYAPLAESEGLRICAEAGWQYGTAAIVCVHRLGALEIGALAVWIGVAAAHRREAFAACQYVIDQLKARVPIWKKEHYADGSAQWVACHCQTPEAADPPLPKEADSCR